MAIISVKEYVRDDAAKKKQYFSEAKEEIAGQNIKFLQIVCIVTVLFLAIFLIVTPVLIDDWQITIYHILFIPFSIGLLLVSFIYGKKGAGDHRVVTALCVISESIIIFFMIMIDVFTEREAPGSFFTPICVVFPAMFIFPLRISYLLTFIFESLYIVLALFYKVHFIAQYDVFSSIVGIAFSFVFAHTILHYRARDFVQRQNYHMLSRRDLLANILNKKGFEESVRDILESEDPGADLFALLLFDIDDFKAVNDTLGHDIGDRLLGDIGEMLPEVFGFDDIIGRFGGDEFIVFIKKAARKEEIEEKCREAHRRVEQIEIKDWGKTITCSIGGVLARYSEKLSYEKLFRIADKALYTSKDEGKNRYSVLVL